MEVVKGYAKHEHNTFTQVSQARASLMNARNIEDIQNQIPSYPEVLLIYLQ